MNGDQRHKVRVRYLWLSARAECLTCGWVVKTRTLAIASRYARNHVGRA
jgi:hypothetical protein